MEILRGRMGDSHPTQAVTCPRSPHICYAITPTGDFTTAEGQHHHSGARVFFDLFARKRRTLDRNPQRGGVPVSFRLFPHSTLQKKRILGLPYGASLIYGRRKPLGNAERSRGSLATVDPPGYAPPMCKRASGRPILVSKGTGNPSMCHSPFGERRNVPCV